MSKLELSKEKIVEVLKSKSPKSLTEIYRHLGGKKLSGSVANKMRTLVEGIDEWVANNKASVPTKTEPVPKSDKEKFRTSKKPGKKPTAKTKIPRHPKNPFRTGSGYSILLDLIANAGSRGIGKEDLLKAYCKATGKDEQHSRYDLAVINSGAVGRTRHRSMKDGVTVIMDGANYQVRFP